MIYKIIIHAVDGERMYVAVSPDKAELLAFLTRYDHEGSSVSLEWTIDGGPDILSSDSTDDAERIYRILAGKEEVGY